jgi:hypothetical protein
LAAVETLPQPPLHHVAHSFDHRSMRAIAGDRPGERSTEAGVIGLGRMGSAIAPPADRDAHDRQKIRRRSGRMHAEHADGSARFV